MWKRRFRFTNSILGFELLAPVDYLWTWRKEIAGKRVIIFIDNSAALSSLIRGDSVSGIAAALAATFWLIAQEANICIWLARGRPKLDIADIPTRYAAANCQKIPDLKFKNLFHILPSSLRWRVVR